MKGFGDFRRMAVIVVPTDEEYVRRQESCKNDIDKDNSETEQNDMKGKRKSADDDGGGCWSVIETVLQVTTL